MQTPYPHALLATLLGTSFLIGGLSVNAMTQNGFQRTPESYELGFVAVTYSRTATAVKLEATYRLPEAGGEARVTRRDGATGIEIGLEGMKPAWSFGGDYSTYVLWAVSAEGHMDNLGEFILKGDRSELNASTTMDSFGLLVTAEPHYLVEAPSPFLVLASREPEGQTSHPSQHVEFEIRYSATPYRFEIDSLVGMPEFDGETRGALRQARVAVILAEQAGASQLVPEAFEAARDALLMTEGAAETRSPTHDDVQVMARRTVRLATTAERMAIEAERTRTAETAER